MRLCEHLGIGDGKAPSGVRASGLVGTVDTSEIDVGILIVQLFLRYRDQRIVELIAVIMADRHAAPVVGLAYEHQDYAFLLRDLPPQGGIHEDHIRLAVAGINHEERKLLAIKAFRNKRYVLARIGLAVAAVVGRRQSRLP